MKKQLIQALNELNADFYRRSGADFSATRNFSWPGWNQLLPFFKKKPHHSTLRILDLGCGNGRLLEFLQIHLRAQFAYLGLDSSEQLLQIARHNYPEQEFISYDLVQKFLATGKIILPTAKKFDLIVLFGLTHHLPSAALRLQLMSDLKNYLAADGYLIVSNWQFASEQERFAKNTLTWSKIWRNKQIGWWRKWQLGRLLWQLEENDYLLDWRQGQSAKQVFRYCHFVSELEMRQLAEAAGLETVSTFHADGKSAQLNQYFVLQALFKKAR